MENNLDEKKLLSCACKSQAVFSVGRQLVVVGKSGYPLKELTSELKFVRVTSLYSQSCLISDFSDYNHSRKEEDAQIHRLSNFCINLITLI